MEQISHISALAREQAIAYTKDPRLALQFHYRKDAAAAAKAIGWPAKSPAEINVMGFKLWAIMDDHCSMLTKTGYALCKQARESE